MTVHLIKLAAGITTLDELTARQERLIEKNGRLFASTRMTPKRSAALLDGGSLYWVIKRKIMLRQLILDIEPFRDNEGRKRCRIILQPDFILTRPQPRRPFQGWRYLEPADAPPDLPMSGVMDADMPETMRLALSELGLL